MDLRNRKLMRTVQIILGVYMLFTIIAGILQFLPPPAYNEAGMAFLTALFTTGYMVYFMQAIFLIAAITFIFNKWSAFGAAILTPITANIILFHIFLDLTGWWMALIFALLNAYLLYVHWPQYKPMFS